MIVFHLQELLSSELLSFHPDTRVVIDVGEISFANLKAIVHVSFNIHLLPVYILSTIVSYYFAVYVQRRNSSV